MVGKAVTLSQAASVFSDTDLTLGSFVGLFSQYIRAVCRQWSCLVPNFSPQISLYKKKILRHIEISAHA
jgi:hypothetical protein